MKVRWTKKAKSTLEDMFEYIRHDNPVAALEVVETIERMSTLCGEFPHIGTSYKQMRIIHLSQFPYSIVYVIHQNFISIVATLAS